MDVSVSGTIDQKTYLNNSVGASAPLAPRGSAYGINSGRILRFSFGPGVKRNFLLAKFLIPHHVRMHRVILGLYIPNTLIKLIIRT